MSKYIGPLCQQGPVLHAYTGKSDTHSIYVNRSPWPVVVTISFGEPGSFGTTGGFDTDGDDVWTSVKVDGKEVALTLAHGANTVSLVAQPGHLVTATADGGHLVYAILGVVAIEPDRRASEKSFPAPKSNIAGRVSTVRTAASPRVKARRRAK